MESAAAGVRRVEPAAGDRVRVVQITDPHIVADAEQRLEGVDTSASLRAVIEAIRERPAPDLILATGDLVHEPSKAAYRRFCEAVAGAPSPVFCLPGNHDDPALVAELLDAPGTVDAGRWRIVLLDDFLEGSTAGRLPPRELERLRRSLEDGPPHVLVAVHHHPVSIGSPWMDRMILQNGEEFFPVLDGSDRVRAVVFGHIHQEFAATRRGVLLLGAPSTCVQFRPGATAYALDPQPPGFRELILAADGSIETRVVRVPGAGRASSVPG